MATYIRSKEGRMVTVFHLRPKETSLIDCTKPDDQILNFINKNHSPGGNPSFSVHDLFSITGEIINNATSSSVVGNILKPLSSNAVELGTGHDTFISPLCLLKSIGCQISSCKASPSDEDITVDSRTEAMLRELCTYSWEAKAVVALAAFALEYGDFWHLAQAYGQGDQLTKSVAILKRVPVLINCETLEKRKIVIEELNNLILDTYRVIHYIFQMEELLVGNDPKDIPTLSSAMRSIPVHIYWSIYTIAACAIQLTRLTGDKEEPCDLSELVRKIKATLKTLETQHGNCLKEIEVEKNYRKIARELAMYVNMIKLINVLILFKDNIHHPVICWGKNETQVISPEDFYKVVEGKYVLFFLSSLDNVSDEAISVLKTHYEEVKKTYNCEIVWIPIEEDWATDTPTKDLLFRKWSSEMPWYAVKYFSSAGRRYLQKEWNCWGNNSAVLVNPQGKLQNTNALSLIQAYQLNFFTFLSITVERLLAPLAPYIENKEVKEWMCNQNKYVLFYGGTIKKESDFAGRAITIQSDVMTEVSISIEFAAIEKDTTTGEHFWSAMKTLFFSLAQGYTDARQVINTLLSYREAEGGWALVTRGCAVVTCGQLDLIAESLESILEWKQGVNAQKIESFGVCLTENHYKVIEKKKKTVDCCKFQIAGNAPTPLGCPVCQDYMETTLVQYSCCHPRFRSSTT